MKKKVRQTGKERECAKAARLEYLKLRLVLLGMGMVIAAGIAFAQGWLP